jgi:hypothetical protein
MSLKVEVISHMGCAVVNVFMDTIIVGCYGVSLLHAVYVLGISRKILLSLICYLRSFCMVMGVVYVVSFFNVDLYFFMYKTLFLLQYEFYLHFAHL